MSYVGLGAMTPAQMAKMYSQGFAAQAAARHTQEQKFEAASPGITLKIAGVERQVGDTHVKNAKLKKRLGQVKTDIAAYEQTVDLQDDLARAQRMPLWILGGGAVLAFVLLSRGRR